MQTCEPLPGCGVLVGTEGEHNANGTPWSYVGEKKGGYEKVETLIWVGEGQGSFDKNQENMAGGARGCLKRLCLCFMCLGLVAGVVCLVYSLIWRANSWGQGGGNDYSVATSPVPGAVMYPTPGPYVMQSTSVIPSYTTNSPLVAMPDPAAIPAATAAPTAPAAPAAPAAAHHASDICSATPHASLSAPQKMWCCANKGIACPKLDCNLGYSNWQNGWSIGKQLWCCKHANKGCHDQIVAGPAAAIEPSQAKATVVGAPLTNVNAPAPRFYDCMAGFSHWQGAWPDEKKTWCCSHYHRGCA